MCATGSPLGMVLQRQLLQPAAKLQCAGVGFDMAPGRVVRVLCLRQRGLEQRQPRVFAGCQVQEPTNDLRRSCRHVSTCIRAHSPTEKDHTRTSVSRNTAPAPRLLRQLPQKPEQPHQGHVAKVRLRFRQQGVQRRLTGRAADVQVGCSANAICRFSATPAAWPQVATSRQTCLQHS